MICYKNLVLEILNKGIRRKATRGGIDTIGIFNYNYKHDLAQGFPILTTKPVSWKNIVIENLWFLSGDNHIEFLHRHGVRFWDPWVQRDGTVPSAYGAFWRKFENPTFIDDRDNWEYLEDTIDQIAWALNKLQKNPDTRQAVITSWDPRNAHSSSLPPCHAMHVLNAQEVNGEYYLNVHLTQRSGDVGLGIPYNLSGYAFLNSLYARFLGMQPGIFAHSIVDAHIYTRSEDGSNAEYDHVPGLKEQLLRLVQPLPTLIIDSKIETLADIDDLVRSNATTAEIMGLFRLDNLIQSDVPIYLKPAV